MGKTNSSKREEATGSFRMDLLLYLLHHSDSPPQTQTVIQRSHKHLSTYSGTANTPPSAERIPEECSGVRV
uniref:Uncharacterized protein n=1 Tax=Knipowitschia caucasica TaxID=637954 RepID=A0AAV2LC99_KNICA